MSDTALAPQPIEWVPDIPHKVKKLSNMRRVIARRLTESKQTVPHIYLAVDVRLDAVLARRAELNAALAGEGVKLSVNDMLVKALALALVEVPACNVNLVGDKLYTFERADVAVAVSIPGGLVTPIVTGAEAKSLAAISAEVKNMAARAQTGGLKPEEYNGGSAALSNMGMFGVRQFDAIINPPHGMILAVGAGEERVVPIDGKPGVAIVMTVTGGFDHRAIDGADGAKLMAAFKRIVEDAAALTDGVAVIGLPGLPLVAPGDDLAALIGDAIAAGPMLRDGDVLVVAQKIVSKAEGRLVRLADVAISPEGQAAADRAGKDGAQITIVLNEAAEVMRVVPGVIITRHRSGHVLANSGVDASNAVAGGGHVVLWPVDPDASARALRAALQTRFGVRIAVIVSDSLGRAWRMGTMGTAIGSAGMNPLRDRRGEPDLFGRTMEATLIGVADEIAAAASLVIGEAAEGTPAAIVRGATYVTDEEAGIGAILRPVAQDLFR